MNEITVTAVGNVATDVRRIQTTSGIALVRFRIASSGRRFDKVRGEWIDLPPTYVTVVCWRGLAENAVASLAKGDPVLATGRLRSRSYEKDGHTETAYEIEATSLGHDLTRGTSSFQRRRRSVQTDESGGVATFAPVSSGDGDDEVAQPAAG